MIEIRERIDKDTEDVKSIISSATDELRSVYRPSNIETKNTIENPLHIVALINGNVVGTAEYLIYESSIFVRRLAVSPTHRRQGVAKAIIEHIKLRAQSDGKTHLELNTIKETGNTSAFLHMGFTIVSESISETFEGVHGEQVTIVNMSKKWHNNR